MIPEWLQTFTTIATIAVWIVLPIQLWQVWRSQRQYKAWERREKADMAFWMQQQAELARERAEVLQMRARLTTELEKVRNR